MCKADDDTPKVMEIQKTKSVSLRNQFIDQWKSKTLEIVARHGRKYNRILTTSDEEFSVALRALNESIDSFDPKRIASFETFANTVITRRLINFFKDKFIPFDKEKISQLVDRKSVVSEREKELAVLRREELSELAKLLSDYGYTWIDVQESRPEHQDSFRKMGRNCNTYRSGLGQRFLDEQPCSKELEMLIGRGIKRRMLKRYRPYLVAVILTFLHHFPIMKDYLLLYRKEEEKVDASQRGSR